MIRIRFAPSPTGYLHIGGVRTALFNFLYARGQKGEFRLRIEDTDRERSRPEYEEEILKALTWLGLHWDGEIIRQSERLLIYRQAAESLLKKGLAYEENIEGKTAVKFKMPKQEALFHDLIHGPVQFNTGLFDDLVLMKSDGFPTYHWACVIDDHEMQITHVIRGDDHLSNTPRQLLLYEAMGWAPPKFAHLPLIVGDDGAPLSKRHGAVSLTHFKEMGFLPEALINYLALLGWGTTGNEEFYTLSSLTKKFSIKRVNKANAKFNHEKLEWLNAQHLKQLPEAEYLSRLQDFHPDLKNRLPESKWKELALLFRTRIKTLKDFKEQASYCFEEIQSYDAELCQELMQEKTASCLSQWIENTGKLSDFEDLHATEKMTRDSAESLQLQAKDLIHPLRFALTGKTVSPGLFELMKVLGKEKCIKRVQKLLRKEDGK